MILKNILPRALERLTVIEAGAPVRKAAALMSKPHTDLIVLCDHGDKVGFRQRLTSLARLVAARVRAAQPG